MYQFFALGNTPSSVDVSGAISCGLPAPAPLFFGHRFVESGNRQRDPFRAAKS